MAFMVPIALQLAALAWFLFPRSETREGAQSVEEVAAFARQMQGLSEPPPIPGGLPADAAAALADSAGKPADTAVKPIGTALAPTETAGETPVAASAPAETEGAPTDTPTASASLAAEPADTAGATAETVAAPIDAADEATARGVVERLASELLSNPLIEVYAIEPIGAASSAVSAVSAGAGEG
jgi:hypothetical protein